MKIIKYFVGSKRNMELERKKKCLYEETASLEGTKIQNHNFTRIPHFHSNEDLAQENTVHAARHFRCVID